MLSIFSEIQRFGFRQTIKQSKMQMTVCLSASWTEKKKLRHAHKNKMWLSSATFDAVWFTEWFWTIPQFTKSWGNALWRKKKNYHEKLLLNHEVTTSRIVCVFCFSSKSDLKSLFGKWELHLKFKTKYNRGRNYISTKHLAGIINTTVKNKDQNGNALRPHWNRNNIMHKLLGFPDNKCTEANALSSFQNLFEHNCSAFHFTF